MSQLTATEKSQIKFHYLISGASPFKLAQLSRVMDNVDYDSFELSRIQDSIASADSAYGVSVLSGGELVADSEKFRVSSDTQGTEVIFEDKSYSLSVFNTEGDRTVTKKSRPSFQTRLSSYHVEVERLSRLLGVSIFG